MTISIRNANPNDTTLIADFNCAIARETESRELDASTITSGVRALLEDAAKGRYWLAEIDDTVVGQIMVTYEWSDWRNGMLWWIQSVYVHEDYRRQGVFSALYRHVEALARSEENVGGIRLYVEEENRRAQSTYSALGMSKTGYSVMESLFEENH